MLKELLNKLRGKSSEEEKEFQNRFVKFYHLNKKRLIKERRSAYYDKKKQGLCVRCNRKAVQGILFCEYHRQRQKSYNQISRSKEKKEIS